MPYAGTIEQDAIIRLVEFRADQLTLDSQVLGQNYSRIYEALEESSRKVLRKARREIALPAVVDDAVNRNAHTTLSASKLTVTLPDNFIRFVRMECSHLTIPIDGLLEMERDMYRLQASPYSGADAFRPIAFLVPDGGTSKMAIELYPGTEEENPITSFFYLPETAPEEIPDVLVDGMVYDAAASLLLHLRENEVAAIALQKAEEALAGLLIGAEGL